MGKDIEEATVPTTSNTDSHDEKLISYEDADVALEFLREHASSGEVDDIDDKKLMRKVDWMIMPLMFGCYYLQYTDKTLRESLGVIL